MADLIVPRHVRRLADPRLARPKSVRPGPSRCRDCGQSVEPGWVVVLRLPSGRSHPVHAGCPGRRA